MKRRNYSRSVPAYLDRILQLQIEVEDPSRYFLEDIKPLGWISRTREVVSVKASVAHCAHRPTTSLSLLTYRISSIFFHLYLFIDISTKPTKMSDVLTPTTSLPLHHPPLTSVIVSFHYYPLPTCKNKEHTIEKSAMYQSQRLSK